MLHPYAAQFEDDDSFRLSLVLPSIAPSSLFGGVATGLDIFMECGRRANARMRFVLDDFQRSFDRAFLERSAALAGVDPSSIAICPRTAKAQPIVVGRNDVFIAYDWWSALNLRPLVGSQLARFGGDRKPLIYLMREYSRRSTPCRRLICSPAWRLR